MSSRQDLFASPDPRTPAQQVAVIAQVLDELASARDLGISAGLDAAGRIAPPVVAVAALDPVPLETAAALDEMLAQAIAEFGNTPRTWGITVPTSAPVLGNGVLQELIAARRRVTRVGDIPADLAHLDERL